MRPRRLKLVVKMFGMEQTIGEIKVTTLARVKEANTERVCPNCGALPKWVGGYECACGQRFSHWSHLKNVIRGLGKAVLQEKLPDSGVAYLYRLTTEKFAEKVTAQLDDYGIAKPDPVSAKNLMKLLVANQLLGYVVVVKFNDTYEERICVLTTNPDQTIVLKELIPDNLLIVNEAVMKMNKETLTEKDIAEAKAFVNLLPEATDELFNVSDYRIQGIDEKPSAIKVEQLEEILATVK